MILGDRRFVEVPGSRTHELPPLLVHTGPGIKRLDRVMEMATDLVEQEEMLPPAPAAEASHFASYTSDSNAHQVVDQAVDWERRRMDLALNLTEQYLSFVMHWHWGNDVLEWIRQCESTFGMRMELRNLLRPDVWPHAGRASFVDLLQDKAVKTGEVALSRAVGMRLTFRQPPPIKCFSNQFLFYLHSSVADTAYQTWASLGEKPPSSLPPERFHFEVLNLSLE